MQQAGFANGSFRTQAHIVIIFDDFGTDKALFEIRVDNAGTLRSLPALVIGPCLDLHLTSGDECFEVQQGICLLDESVYAALFQSEFFEEHQFVLVGFERCDVFLCLCSDDHALSTFFLGDFLTDIVVLAFVKLSSKPADHDHDYGHGKYETIATSIIGMALVIVAVMLGWNGTEKIIQVVQGEKLESPGIIALVAALASIALKEWVFRITRKVAHEVNSQALEANAWHHRSDALSSIGTAIGIGGAVLLGNSWTILDPWYHEPDHWKR